MTRVAAAVLAVFLAGMSACGGGSVAAGSSVMVLGSWTGAEAEAFQAVIRPFEERTGIRVDYTTTRDLRGAIADGLGSGHPADLVGLDGPGHLRELAAGGDLRDLGEVIDLQQYKEAVAPTFVELGSLDGSLLGVFLKATVKGLLWYNPAIFDGQPDTFADLQWMSARYLDADTQQWCIGLGSGESSGWPGTDLIESFLIHQSGVDAYDRWVTGELPWDSPEVRQAFEAYGRVVAVGAVHGGPAVAIGTRFEHAGDPLFTNPPGCLFLHQASFMPTFFTASAGRAGVGFDFMPFPPMSATDHGAVIGAGDLFGMLTDNLAAAELMRYLVSADAQEILVAHGGALSVDQRVGGYPNDVVRREAAILARAEHFRFDASDLMPAALNRAFLDAVLDYTRSPLRLSAILDRLERTRVTVYGT